MHEVEEPRGIVLHLDVDVELYVTVLGLNGSDVSPTGGRGGWWFTGATHFHQ